MPEFQRTTDLLASGWTKTAIGEALAQDTLAALRRGLYSCLPPKESARPKILANAQACAAEAVVSHWSAAWVHELPVDFQRLSKVHLTRSRRSGARISSDIKLYACPIRDGDAVRLDDLGVTTVARTVVDVARHDALDGWAFATGDHALRAGLVTMAELNFQLARAARRPWISQARRIVGLLDDRAESPGESRSRWFMLQAGLPQPDLQVKVPARGGQIEYEVDFLWEDYGVIGEFDGDIKYGDLAPGSDAWRAWKVEKRRHEDLQAEGYVVVRWTWDELNNPIAFAAKLRNAFLNARRMRERLARPSA